MERCLVYCLLFFLLCSQLVPQSANAASQSTDDSDEFYEWLIWKIAQKYDGERGNGALEKRVNWNALKNRNNGCGLYDINCSNRWGRLGRR